MRTSPEEFSKNLNLTAPAFRLAAEAHLAENANEIHTQQVLFAAERTTLQIMPIGLVTALNNNEIQVTYIPFFTRLSMREVADTIKTVTLALDLVSFLISFDAKITLIELETDRQQIKSEAIVTIWKTVWGLNQCRVTKYKAEEKSFLAEEVKLENNTSLFSVFDDVLPKLNIPPQAQSGLGLVH